MKSRGYGAIMDAQKSGNTVPTSSEKADLTARISAFVKLAIESFGTIAKAAEAADVSKDQLTRWRDGLATPGFPNLGRLCVAMNYPMETLITGDRRSLTPHSSLIGLSEGGGTAPYALIPRYGVSAAAGSGLVAIGEEVAERVAFNTNWLRDLGLSLQYLGLVTCTGDSQNPTIPDGSLMLIDMTPDQQIRSGKFYVIVLDGDLLVKRVFRRADGSVDLISDNPIYPKENVQASYLERLNIPGRVAWIFHDM